MSDLTLLQRKYFSSILSELKLKKDAGKHSLFIKYIIGLLSQKMTKQTHAKWSYNLYNILTLMAS